MLAFIITGSATSTWVIAGLSTFLRKRAILLYVGFVLAGGLVCRYLYDLALLIFKQYHVNKKIPRRICGGGAGVAGNTWRARFVRKRPEL
jgi:hypothetical protein